MVWPMRPMDLNHTAFEKTNFSLHQGTLRLLAFVVPGQAIVHNMYNYVDILITVLYIPPNKENKVVHARDTCLYTLW